MATAITPKNFEVKKGLIVNETSNLKGAVSVTANVTVTEGQLSVAANGTPHTIAGSSNLGAGTLIINGTNKRAIINATSTGTGSTDWAWEVVGRTRLGGLTSITGNTTITGNTLTLGTTSASANLHVYGSISANGELNVDGDVTLSSNSITLGSGGGTTPHTVVVGKLLVTGGIATAPTADKASATYYDLDAISGDVNSVPILKVYNVNGTQVFP